jgi:hypothetical protein
LITATRNRHSPVQIVRKPTDRSAEGLDIMADCRELGISYTPSHRWPSQFGGFGVEDPKRLKVLDCETATLKRLWLMPIG